MNNKINDFESSILEICYRSQIPLLSTLVAFTCLKSTIETLEKGVKYVQN